LSPGDHQITLFIVDSNGQSDSTTILVNVVGEEKEDEVIIEGLEDWMVYGLIGIIVILIIIIMLAALLGTGTKKSEPDEEEEREKPRKGKPPEKSRSGKKPAAPPKPKSGAKMKK
jgi:hypothetical protein